VEELSARREEKAEEFRRIIEVRPCPGSGGR